MDSHISCIAADADIIPYMCACLHSNNPMEEKVKHWGNVWWKKGKQTRPVKCLLRIHARMHTIRGCECHISTIFHLHPAHVTCVFLSSSNRSPLLLPLPHVHMLLFIALHYLQRRGNITDNSSPVSLLPLPWMTSELPNCTQGGTSTCSSQMTALAPEFSPVRTTARQNTLRFKYHGVSSFTRTTAL